MSITADYHLHSSHSGDSETPMLDMIKKGLELGLTHMCFTEHMDIDFPDSADCPGSTFLLNTDSYLFDLAKYKTLFEDRMQIRFGVELGLQPHLLRENSRYVREHDFDFVIGSSHIVDHQDPYYPAFYEGRTEKEAYRSYFESILANLKRFDNFDVYGHLDYVVRYGPNKNKEYSYQAYADIIDEILKTLIEKEKGIELNTSGIRAGLGEPNPCIDVIRRYHELGGEIITVGSDAHTSADIASEFKKAEEILLDCGFKYYAIYQFRIPEFKRL